VRTAQRLDGRLAVDHRGDDLTVLGDGLASDDDKVAVADRGVDHRVADDGQEEEVTVADELTGEREDLLDLLVGGDRDTGGDASDQRHERRVAEGR